MPVKPTDSREITRNYFDALLVEQRLFGITEPDLSLTLFGHKFSTPIMTAALSHLKRFNPGFDRPMEAYATGAKLSNTLHWLGMCESEEFHAVMDCGAKTIRIVKPYADREKALAQLREAEAEGCIAVGMDMDHMLNSSGEPDLCMGDRLAFYTDDDWKQMIAATKLPFVMKGVLSVRDALHCRELGIDGIVVSHHNGRLESAVPPLMVLPEIRSALGPDYPIFVDCGISSGMDAYKALALGATAVSVGTYLIPFTARGGAAVAAEIDKLSARLKGCMASTGVKDTASFDASVIHLRQF